MKIYSRYIAASLISPAIFITLALTCVVWLTQSLKYVDFIINRGLPVSTYIYLTTLLVPSLLGVVMPIALFCAVLYTYNRLVMESELSVLRTAGLSPMALARPAIIVGAVITSFAYLISFYLLPASYREFKDIQSFLRDNYASVLLQEGVFNNPEEGLTVYIRSREPDGTLKGILVHDNRKTDNPVTMMAEKGMLVRTPEGPRFVLENGSRQEINKNAEKKDRNWVSVLYFDHYNLDISFYTAKNLSRVRDPEERFFWELLNPEKSLEPEKRNRLTLEAHQRIVWPLYNLALCLMALAALIPGDYNRRGQSAKIISVVGLASISVMLWLAARNMAGSSLAAGTALMYLNLAVISGFSCYMLFSGAGGKSGVAQ